MDDFGDILYIVIFILLMCIIAFLEIMKYK